MRTTIGTALLLAAILLAWGMLSLDGQSVGTAQTVRQPFVNAVEQRNAVIRELKEIKALLKEQNALLRAARADAAPQQP